MFNIIPKLFFLININRSTHHFEQIAFAWKQTHSWRVLLDDTAFIVHVIFVGAVIYFIGDFTRIFFCEKGWHVYLEEALDVVALWWGQDVCVLFNQFFVKQECFGKLWFDIIWTTRMKKFANGFIAILNRLFFIIPNITGKFDPPLAESNFMNFLGLILYFSQNCISNFFWNRFNSFNYLFHFTIFNFLRSIKLPDLIKQQIPLFIQHTQSHFFPYEFLLD